MRPRSPCSHRRCGSSPIVLTLPCPGHLLSVSGGPDILVTLFFVGQGCCTTGPDSPGGLKSVTTILSGFGRTMAGEPIVQTTQRTTR